MADSLRYLRLVERAGYVSSGFGDPFVHAVAWRYPVIVGVPVDAWNCFEEWCHAICHLVLVWVVVSWSPFVLHSRWTGPHVQGVRGPRAYRVSYFRLETIRLCYDVQCETCSALDR